VLGFYFMIAPSTADADSYGDLARAYLCAEPDPTLTFRWFPVAELTSAIRPSFLATALRDLPIQPTLIAHESR
jgi:hypothetical protein